jgi:histidinol-phosphate/aromatic aminotransferase/cobyric acid decarboxylase-like protein
VVYLCLPNSPTGAALPAAAVAAWAARRSGVRVVLDQSFLSLSDRWADAAVAMPANVVRVRSLTKDHAIPGVRAGYALAASDVVKRIATARPAWTVSAHAAAATRTACGDDAFVARSRMRLADDRDRLHRELAALGLPVVAAAGPFLLVRVGQAAEVRDRLLRRHQMLVRDCTSFGLPDHIRVAARPRPDAERLLAALRDERG